MMHVTGTLRAQPTPWWTGLGADGSVLMTGPVAATLPPAPAPVVQQQTVPLTQPTSTQSTPGTVIPTDAGQVPLYQKLSTTPLAPGVKPPTDEDTAYLYTLINVQNGGTALFPFTDVTSLWNNLWTPAPTAQDARRAAAMGSVLQPNQPVAFRGIDELARSWGFTQDPNVARIVDWAYSKQLPWLTTNPYTQQTWQPSDATANWDPFNWRFTANRYMQTVTDKNPGGLSYYIQNYVGPILTVIVGAMIGAYGIGPALGAGSAATMGGAAAGAAIGTAATSFVTPSAPAALDLPTLSPNFNEALLQQPAQGQVPLMATPGLPTSSFQYEAQSSGSPIPLTPEQEAAMAAQDDMVKGWLVVGVLGAIAIFGGKK